jgi:hypothetical protein
MISSEVKRRLEQIEAQTVAHEDEEKRVIRIVGIDPLTGSETAWHEIQISIPPNSKGSGGDKQ